MGGLLEKLENDKYRLECGETGKHTILCVPVLNKLNMKYDAEFALNIIYPKGFKSMLSKQHFHTTIHNSTVTVAQRWPTTRYIKV